MSCTSLENIAHYPFATGHLTVTQPFASEGERALLGDLLMISFGDTNENFRSALSHDFSRH